MVTTPRSSMAHSHRMPRFWISARERACRHHVVTNGVVLVQRYTAQWAELAAGTSNLGAGIRGELTLESLPTTESTHVSVTAAYTLGTRQWEQA